MATLRLFEVRGADVEFRPSPYCWRIRMALAHKGLAFEPVPWRAVDKERIARSGGTTVPVLVDGTRWIGESWDIAVYLDQAYPGVPLFRDDATMSKARELDMWVTRTLHPLLAQAMVVDQFPLLAPQDQAFYKQRTLTKFGKTLEELGAHPERAIVEMRHALAPVEAELRSDDYLGGASHDYRDYLLFGVLQCGRVTMTRALVSESSEVGRWFSRMLDAFDGFGRAQPSRRHWECEQHRPASD
ncbi:MAG: glutathione S-transferase N-terminal domain-containing protein [Polyangiales bacterium]